MRLREYQEECVKAVEDAFNEFKRVLVVMATGCHEPEQGIMMFDGTVKMAKDIVVGDVLMGDDSSPRTVLKLVRGYGDMYKIYPTKGKPFVVNNEHILSLSSVRRENRGKKEGEITNISVMDYLSSTKYFKHMNKLYFNKIDFQDKYGSMLSPYFVGLMLGDGSLNHCIGFTSEDKDIISWMADYGEKTGLFFMKETKSNCGNATDFILSTEETGRSGSRLSQELVKLGIRHTTCSNKFIPHELKTSSEENRLAVLAGLLDTDGSYIDGCYDFISKSKQLSDDVCFVARSLGMMANVVPCKKSSQNRTIGTYYRVCISGDFSSLPVICKHKIPKKRKQKKRANVTGIKNIESIGKGEYFGFTVDGNNLYLMDDFIVTHNCGKTVVFNKLADDEIKKGKRVLVLAHRGELLQQAVDKMVRFNGIEGTIIKADAKVDMNSMFYVASVQSMCKEDRLNQFPKDYFSMIICDEAHHAMADTYQRVFDYFEDCNVLGVTATPSRSDQKKLSAFFQTTAFEYDLEDAIKDGWLSDVIGRTANIEVDLSKVRTVAGDFVVNELDNAIIKNFRGISRYIKNNLMTRKKILIFTPRVASAELLSIALKKEGLAAEFVCGESKNREEILLKYNRGEIQVLCNSLLLCLSMDTEILTNRGFVRHEHLLSDDLVANWDNGNVYFEKPKHVFSREVGPGETFVEHNGSISSFKVTNNHNMVVRRGRRWIKKAAEDISRGIFPACGVSEPFTITIKQDERQKVNRRISANSYNYRKSNPNMTHEESVNLAVERIEADTRKKKQPNELTLDECRFIGFWIADGSVNHLRKGGVEYTLCQSERYGEIIFWIDNVLKNIGVDFLKKRKSPSSKTTNCHYIWSVPRGTGFGCQKRNGVYHLEPYLKKSSNDLLWALNEEQFDALIEGYWYGDGNHLGAESGFPKSISFNDTHLDFIDQLCAIGSVRGWRCATSLRKSKDVRHKDQLYLRMIKNANINIGSGYITKNVKPEEGEHVWCVKTSSGNIITRRNGKVMVMGNCEGFDEPEIDCVINLRPTQSNTLFKQMIGRGTRPHVNKDNVLVVDFLWKTDRDVINPCSLFAKNDTMSTAMRDFLVMHVNKSYDLSKLSSYMDMVMGGLHLMEGARRTCQTELSKRGKNSPAVFAFIINNKKILEYEPIHAWEMMPPTIRQIDFLEQKCNISCKKVNKGLASKLIDAIVKRIERQKCTVKQMFLLARSGIFDKAPDISMEEAREIIDAIANNNWMIPSDMLRKYGGKKRLETPLIDIEKMAIEPIAEGQRECAMPFEEQSTVNERS